MAKLAAYALNHSRDLFLVVSILLFLVLLKYVLLAPADLSQRTSAALSEASGTWNTRDVGTVPESGRKTLETLGVLASRKSQGWSALACDRYRKLRRYSAPTPFGKLTLYVYDSFNADTMLSTAFLKGAFFERAEMAAFLNLSRDLPLVDVGANVGLVTLQAALQGRQVVSVEPIPENALRLCRSVLDFGYSSLVHVVRNAASSEEGNVTLAIGVAANARTQYEVSRAEGWGHDATTVYAIQLDRLLEVLPFRRAALKIDVEGHEGHVLAGATRLFQEVDFPLVWMEWGHVKSRRQYGGEYVINYMQERHYKPYNLMTGRLLFAQNFMEWPFTVLWRKS